MTRLRRDDSGATAVEFAIVAPIVFLMLGAIFCLAMTMVYSGLADYAARVALRTAVVHDVNQYAPAGYATEAQVKTKVNGLFATDILTNPTSVSVTSVAPASAPTTGQGDTVTVTVVYQVPVISTIADLIPGQDMKDLFKGLSTITRTAKGRRE